MRSEVALRIMRDGLKDMIADYAGRDQLPFTALTLIGAMSSCSCALDAAIGIATAVPELEPASTPPAERLYLVQRSTDDGTEGAALWLTIYLTWSSDITDAKLYRDGAALNAVCEDFNAVAKLFEARP